MNKKTTDDKIKQLRLALPPDVKEWLINRAREKGMSEESYINKILSEYVAENKENDYIINNYKEDENIEHREIIEELYKILRKF